MADKIFGQGLDPETLVYVAKAPALPKGISPRPVHITGLPTGGEAAPVTVASITDATAVGRSVLKAANAGAARTAIGATDLALGSTATTAAAGNHVHAATVVTVAAGAGIVGANVQAVLANLASRVVALEAKP